MIAPSLELHEKVNLLPETFLESCDFVLISRDRRFKDQRDSWARMSREF